MILLTVLLFHSTLHVAPCSLPASHGWFSAASGGNVLRWCCSLHWVILDFTGERLSLSLLRHLIPSHVLGNKHAGALPLWGLLEITRAAHFIGTGFMYLSEMSVYCFSTTNSFQWGQQNKSTVKKQKEKILKPSKKAGVPIAYLPDVNLYLYFCKALGAQQSVVADYGRVTRHSH